MRERSLHEIADRRCSSVKTTDWPSWYKRYQAKPASESECHERASGKLREPIADGGRVRLLTRLILSAG